MLLVPLLHHYLILAEWVYFVLSGASRRLIQVVSGALLRHPGLLADAAALDGAFSLDLIVVALLFFLFFDGRVRSGVLLVEDLLPDLLELLSQVSTTSRRIVVLVNVDHYVVVVDGCGRGTALSP